MALRGLRKVVEDFIRAKAAEAMSAGAAVRWGDAVDSDTRLNKLFLATSGNAKFVGIVGDRVIAKPTLAQASSDSQIAGIRSDWVFTEATPLFQEEGVRYVGEEVFVIRRGYLATNLIPAGQTPSGGVLAYAQPNGYVGTTASGLPIGVWQTSKDSDGYAELYLNPQLDTVVP